MRSPRAWALALLWLGALAGLWAQGLGSLPQAYRLTVVERSDFRRSVDGASLGFVYRESRGALRADGSGGYDGDLLILEEVYKDAGLRSRKVERSQALALDGLSQTSGAPGQDRGFPTHRFLLAQAPETLSPGLSWISEARIALDPLGNGSFVVLPVLVEYRVVGPSRYGERAVTAIKGKFALRYGGGGALSGLAGIQGSHDLDLSVDALDGSLVFLRDRFDEAYALAGGRTEKRTGFILAFYKGSSLRDQALEVARLTGSPSPPGPAAGAAPRGPADSPNAPNGRPFAPPGSDPALSQAGPGDLIPGDASTLDEGPLLAPDSALAKAGVDLVSAKEGLVLRIKDLRFVADKDEILPEERWRLDALAEALARIPERTFLVEGHSAAVGRPAGELELSERRAKRVVDELVARGLPPGRFIYRGLGSSQPLAPNTDEAGRSKNRRVEITILE